MFELVLLSAWLICVVGVSALLHECGHACAARAVGWEVVGLRWHWYGLGLAAEANGRSDELWKVALGGPCATAVLALGFLAGTELPEPAPLIFWIGFVLNATFLVTQLAPLPRFDGGQALAGLRRAPSSRDWSMEAERGREG
jgi:Zn-dependent protease